MIRGRKLKNFLPFFLEYSCLLFRSFLSLSIIKNNIKMKELLVQEKNGYGAGFMGDAVWMKEDVIIAAFKKVLDDQLYIWEKYTEFLNYIEKEEDFPEIFGNALYLSFSLEGSNYSRFISVRRKLGKLIRGMKVVIHSEESTLYIGKESR